MGAFLAIGQWYESREKTLAHIDEEVVKEMKHYLSVKEQMQADADNQGISIESYCILNPFTALPYLRNFPCSAYCAIEWKKKTDSRWTKRHRNWGRYGVDTKVSIGIYSFLKTRSVYLVFCIVYLMHCLFLF